MSKNFSLKRLTLLKIILCSMILSISSTVFSADEINPQPMHHEAPSDPPPLQRAIEILDARSSCYKEKVHSYESVQVNCIQNENIIGDAANEPSIAANSNNEIVIGWRDFGAAKTSNFREAGCGFSNDGGQTWTYQGVIKSGDDPNVAEFRTDPVLDTDSDGNFYYQSLRVLGCSDTESHCSTDDNLTLVLDVFKSVNGGPWQDLYKEYEVIAQTGDILNGLKTIELGWGPSINDAGKIAFTTEHPENENGQKRHGVFVSDGETMVSYTGLSAVWNFSDAVQINNQDQVVYHQRSFDNLFSNIIRHGGDLSDFKKVAQNLYERLDIGVVQESPFAAALPRLPHEALFPLPTLNNRIDGISRVVFSATLKSNPTHTVLATPVNTETGGIQYAVDFHIAPPLVNYPLFSPMIADNGRVVVRGGRTETAPIMVFVDENLDVNTALGIATTPTFSVLGQRPGISDDGRIVAFVAEHSERGSGIFISEIGDNWFTEPFKIVGREGDRITMFDITTRIGINRTEPNT